MPDQLRRKGVLTAWPTLTGRAIRPIASIKALFVPYGNRVHRRFPFGRILQDVAGGQWSPRSI